MKPNKFKITPENVKPLSAVRLSKLHKEWLSFRPLIKKIIQSKILTDREASDLNVLWTEYMHENFLAELFQPKDLFHPKDINSWEWDPFFQKHGDSFIDMQFSRMIDYITKCKLKR